MSAADRFVYDIYADMQANPRHYADLYRYVSNELSRLVSDEMQMLQDAIVANYLTGDRTPRLLTACRIADVLCVGLDELVGRDY